MKASTCNCRNYHARNGTYFLIMLALVSLQAVNIVYMEMAPHAPV